MKNMGPWWTGYAASTRGANTPVAPTRRLAIYAFYDSVGHVPDYVTFKLKALKEHVEKLVVVVNGVIDDDGRARIEAIGASVHVRPNTGYDIWGYRFGLIEVVGWNQVDHFDEVLLLNSTFYGPLYPFSELFGEMESRDTDFWGITGFKGPVPNGFTFQGMISFHIQSYFMAFRKRVTSSRAFRDWWELLPPLDSYVEAVLKHETRFTEFLAQQGFRYSLYCDPLRYKVVNPAFDVLDLLVEHRCPILKRRAFFHEPLYLELNNVELNRAVDIIRRNGTYDLALIWSDITRTTRPVDLYTNATQLEVISPEEPTSTPKTRRVLVLAHVDNPSQLPELLTAAKNITVPFDLIVTANDETLRPKLQALQAEAKLPASSEVRIGHRNASGALSAMMLTCRDAVTDPNYELVCSIHGATITGATFARDRQFKKHHLGNLLGTQGVATRIMELFEDDPSLGVVMPPTVHIAHSTRRDHQSPGTVEWTKTLGITAPLDIFTAETPAGMFWFRPRALRLLLDFKFEPLHFEPQPNEYLELILRRLVWPAAHTVGHTVKCVLTPASMAANYVKLEYKLQKSIAEPIPPRKPDFPRGELKAFVRDRLADRPSTLAVVETSFRAARGLFRAAKTMTSTLAPRELR